MTPARTYRIFRHRLRSLVRKDAVDREVARELSLHFDLLVAENITSGMRRDQATRAARHALGNISVLEDECRDQRRVAWLFDLIADVRFACRLLRKTPAFAVCAVAFLAVGLGATGASLALLGSLTLAPLPYPAADRLTVFRTYDAKAPQQLRGVGLQDYLAWRAGPTGFDGFGLAVGSPGVLAADGPNAAERVEGQLFDTGMVSLLAPTVVAGRMFTGDDPPFGAPDSVVVISHRLWLDRYDADPSIVGRQVRLNRSATTIVGVMSPAFSYPHNRIDYWAPMWGLRPDVPDHARMYDMVGRLAPGESLGTAMATLETVEPHGWKLRGQSLRDTQFGWTTLPLVTVAGAVALVLLMSCANLAALSLGKAAAREQELALRLALGAPRDRIVRQLLTESLVITGVASMLGIAVAWATIRLLRMMAPLPGLPGIPPLASEATLVAGVLVLGIAAAIGIGLLPALRSSHVRPIQTPAVGRRSATNPSLHYLRKSLVGLQTATAVVLLVVAALLVASVARLGYRDLHFDANGLVAFDFRMSPNDFSRPTTGGEGTRIAYRVDSTPQVVLQRILDRLRQLPGVESVAGISHHPTNTLLLARPSVQVEDAQIESARIEDVRPPTDAGSATSVYFLATPGLFHTMGATIVKGREFNVGDSTVSPWVAVVNEAFVRRFMAGRDPLGTRVRLTVESDEEHRQIVGVVRDIPTRRAQVEAEPVIYAPFGQQAPLASQPRLGMFGRMTFMVRAAGGSSPQQLVPHIRRAVADIAPDDPLANLSTNRIDRYFVGRSVYVFVVCGFAMIATLIAAYGLYGVVSYSVAQRRREIAIRVALGASARQVWTVMCREALAIVCAGIGVGLVAAVFLTRFIASQLWGTSPTDMRTYVGVAVVTAAIGLTACTLATRRSLSSSPIEVLKAD